MRTTIVIPTFWRGPEDKGHVCEFESDYIYEHSTPLDQEGTLAEALGSLAVLETAEEFAVAVVAVPTRQELKQAVELRVQTIVAQFEYKYPILVVGPEEIMLWRRRLAEKGLFQYDHFLSLEGYANVRNVCLLAAVLAGSDVAILFDDDEVYEDPDYIRKALEFIGNQHEGSFVAGVTGFSRGGGTEGYYAGDNEWQGKWGLAASMKDALGAISAGPRLQRAPLAFGGNMVIHRTVFEKVPFDPAIPRGEDIDYLMNAGLLGYEFFFDNQLWTRQGISSGCAPPWYELRLDIIRFARERAKLAAPVNGAGSTMMMDPGDFDPYPGRFLKDDLHDIVFEASLAMAGRYFEDGREEEAGECIMNIAISKAEARVRKGALSEYIDYQQQWQEFVGLAPTLDIWRPPSMSD